MSLKFDIVCKKDMDCYLHTPLIIQVEVLSEHLYRCTAFVYFLHLFATIGERQLPYTHFPVVKTIWLIWFDTDSAKANDHLKQR